MKRTLLKTAAVITLAGIFGLTVSGQTILSTKQPLASKPLRHILFRDEFRKEDHASVQPAHNSNNILQAQCIAEYTTTFPEFHRFPDTLSEVCRYSP